MSGRQRTQTSRSPEFSSEPGRRGLFGKPTLFVFWLFVVVVCAALLIPAVPQYRLLKEIEAELANVEREEKTLRDKKDQLEAENRALKKNPRYLEARARDPLRVQLKGETVIQFGN
jgi:cell division protein FtsB